MKATYNNSTTGAIWIQH